MERVQFLFLANLLLVLAEFFFFAEGAGGRGTGGAGRNALIL